MLHQAPPLCDPFKFGCWACGWGTDDDPGDDPEAPPSQRLQSLADGLAIVVDGLHGPTVPVRVTRHVTPLLDSIVVALTDLAGELAGAELWAGLPHDFAGAFAAARDLARAR